LENGSRLQVWPYLTVHTVLFMNSTTTWRVSENGLGGLSGQWECTDETERRDSGAGFANLCSADSRHYKRRTKRDSHQPPATVNSPRRPAARLLAAEVLSSREVHHHSNFHAGAVGPRASASTVTDSASRSVQTLNLSGSGQ